MIIKVCGMRQPQNIHDVATTGINWIGMIFWPKSSRYVSDLTSAIAIPEGIVRVGVFVNQANDFIAETTRQCNIDIVQLHGNESPDDINKLRSILPAETKIMKAISVSNEADISKAYLYSETADYLLFDTKCPSVGGSGNMFDWSVLNSYKGTLPFLLSGGIGSDDAESIINFHHQKMIGIDLNSRFETAPAEKDVNKLKVFIEKIRKHEQDK